MAAFPLHYEFTLSATTSRSRCRLKSSPRATLDVRFPASNLTQASSELGQKRTPEPHPQFAQCRPFAGCRNLFDHPVGAQQHGMQNPESPRLKINSIVRGTGRLQARHCGAPASPSHLAAGLIRRSLRHNPASRCNGVLRHLPEQKKVCCEQQQAQNKWNDDHDN